MNETLLLLLKLSVATSIFAIGLGSTAGDLTYLLRRPGLLVRSLLAMYVLVPVAALALVALLPLAPGVKAALLVLAVSAGAPMLPKKLGSLGADSYVFSLVVLSSLLAIVLVPMWVAALAELFGVAAELPPRVIALAIAKAFLLPLIVGMVLGRLWSRLARAAESLLAVAGTVLMACGVLLLVMNFELLRSTQSLGFFALLLLLVAALAIGHFMGGPTQDERTALGIACATRHIGLAALVAASFPGPRTVTLIAVYVVASAAVTMPYLKWRKSRAAARGETGQAGSQ